MIDLTPLDVRSKRGDFKKLMRGYDPQEVDTFLELAAERLEELTRENIALRERAQTLQQQVDSQSNREHAVQEALVTAQELRADIRGQAQREADGILKEAETEGRKLMAEAEAEARTKVRSSERRLEQFQDSLQEIERRRARFLKEFRQLLERELDVVQVEEGLKPLEERTIDLDLGGKHSAAAAPAEEAPPASELGPVDHEATTLEVPVLEELPPPDAPVDQLAAAYQAAEPTAPMEVPPELPPPAVSQPIDSAPPPRKLKKHDNLLLYLDTDDDA